MEIAGNKSYCSFGSLKMVGLFLNAFDLYNLNKKHRM